MSECGLWINEKKDLVSTECQSVCTDSGRCIHSKTSKFLASDLSLSNRGNGSIDLKISKTKTRCLPKEKHGSGVIPIV